MVRKNIELWIKYLEDEISFLKEMQDEDLPDGIKSTYSELGKEIVKIDLSPIDS